MHELQSLGPNSFSLVDLISFVFFIMPAPSGYPQNIVATVTSPRTITLTWELPLYSERNGIIISYSINITDIEAETQRTYSTSSFSYSLSVEPYTSYALYIAAATEVGLGPYSTATQIRTPEAGESWKKERINEI